MKILACGDNHFDAHSRFDECVRVHKWIAQRTREEQPDLFLLAGDLYERSSTPIERLAARDFVRSIADVCPVLIVRGNHDAAHDVELLGSIQAKHPIKIEEGAGIHTFSSKTKVFGATVAAVAWPNTASVAAMAGVPLAPEDVDSQARLLLANVLRGLGDQLARSSGARILLAHAMVDGSETSTGQPLIGAELRLSLQDLALAQAHVNVFGHIHKPQAWQYGDALFFYCGSPYRTAYGEVEEKSIVCMEFDGSNLKEWHRIPTPARPMVLIECSWQNGGLTMAQVPNVKDAEVRVRLSNIPRDQRDAARKVLSDFRQVLLKVGASAVKLEEHVEVTSKARAPEVAQARTVHQKLEAAWAARGNVPPPDRAARLLAKLSQLEVEVSR